MLLITKMFSSFLTSLNIYFIFYLLSPSIYLFLFNYFIINIIVYLHSTMTYASLCYIFLASDFSARTFFISTLLI